MSLRRHQNTRVGDLQANGSRFKANGSRQTRSAAGETISDIFAQYGEPYFRQGEARVIARLLQNGPQVLATGGGAYMDAGSRANIKAHGVSVWLRAELPVLMHRVKRRDNRPLLKGGDPETVMRALMEQRYPVYAEADVTVQSREQPHDVIVLDVVEAISRFLGVNDKAAKET